MGVHNLVPDAIAEHKAKLQKPHFLFSAENPVHPHKQDLKITHEEALHHLQSRGFDAHEVQGHYGSPERSIIVYGVGPKTAEHLHNFASRLGQDSSIHSDGQNHEMRFHHGLKAGKRVRGKGTVWHDKKPNDFYTSLPGETHHFTHSFEEEAKSEDTSNPHRSSIKAGDYTLAKAGEPNEKVRAVADSYASKKGIKLNHNLPNHTVDPQHASKIASAYESMKHDPSNPDVKRAYGALVGETKDQFHHIMNNGLKISRIQPGQENPYKNSKDLHNDIKNNNHMWFYPTESGFGSGDSKSDHPMLAGTGVHHEGKELLANDMFRVVHDYFGHGKEGHSFGARGEDNAWKHHSQMYSPDAQRALTSETRGQNSWVNFGPHGEHNKKNPSKTIYAEQKAGLLPSWASHHEDKSEIFKSEKVGDLKAYKENAKQGCDVMFRVKVKDKSKLDAEIPLHMSIKIFKSVEEADVEKIKKQIAELGLTERPDPKKLKFKNTIFTGKDGNKYFMLMIEGLDPKFEEFYKLNSDRGTVYDNGFMPHFTISKELYNDINENGLTPDEVEFGPLIMEEGAGNTHCEFEDNLEKGIIGHSMAVLGAVGAMSGNPKTPAMPEAPKATIQHVQPAQPKMDTKPKQESKPKQENKYSSKRMLNTIASVESNQGQNTHHKPLPMSGMHHGESAFGKYALTPTVIRETVHMHPDLKSKYKKVMSLHGDDVKRYMEDNPGLEDVIASRHLQRLEHHFGKDPSSIGYAWLEGVSGTYKAKKQNKDIAAHWHVKKINNAYSRAK